jgi:hypothetical protein
MKHLLVDVYQVDSNKRPRVKIAPLQETSDFPYIYMYFVKSKNRKSSCENSKEVELWYLA